MLLQRHKTTMKPPGTPVQLMRRARQRGLVLLAVLLWGGNAHAVAADFTAQVSEILAGDVIRVFHDGRHVTIRLNGVDCPEKRQPHGAEAKRFTAFMIFGRTVTVRPLGTDEQGRTIADVVLESGRILSQELLKEGLAWWDRRHSRDETLSALEQDARLYKHGLWEDPDPIPPWEWRKRHPRR